MPFFRRNWLTPDVPRLAHTATPPHAATVAFLKAPGLNASKLFVRGSRVVKGSGPRSANGPATPPPVPVVFEPLRTLNGLPDSMV